MAGIDRETIEKIENLVESKKMIQEIDGNTYTRFNLKQVYSDPRPSKLNLSTLDGVADYINNNLDGVNVAECMIVIDSYNQVSVYSPVKGESNDRHLIVRAELTEMDRFRFGDFIEQEEFIISLASLFKTTDEKTKIIQAVSQMSVVSDETTNDNGITTEKTSMNGIICGSEDIKPVVTLQPYRTFREVEQPKSAFIFRFKKGRNGTPVIALFEADGGTWKIEAKKLIKDYLSEKVKSPIIS